MSEQNTIRWETDDDGIVVLTGGEAWRTRMRQAVPYTAALLAVLFIVRGLGLGIPYLSPQLSATAVPAKRPPLTVHYCH